MKTLILNADDLGMTRGINDAIIRAHRQGILTSATLMATGLEFDDAVAKVKTTPALGIGCHVVLTGGVAVTQEKKSLLWPMKTVSFLPRLGASSPG